MGGRAQYTGGIVRRGVFAGVVRDVGAAVLLVAAGSLSAVVVLVVGLGVVGFGDCVGGVFGVFVVWRELLVCFATVWLYSNYFTVPM